MVVQDGRALRAGVKSQQFGLHGIAVAVSCQVKDDEVGIAIVRVLEASDHIAVVLGQVQVGDVVREADRGFVPQGPDGFVGQKVIDDNGGACVEKDT